jgi:hypothetical protein
MTGIAEPLWHDEDDPASTDAVSTDTRSTDWTSTDAASTGHPQVDDALAALARVATRPPAEQIGAYEAAHEALRTTLSSIEES